MSSSIILCKFMQRLYIDLKETAPKKEGQGGKKAEKDLGAQRPH